MRKVAREDTWLGYTHTAASGPRSHKPSRPGQDLESTRAQAEERGPQDVGILDVNPACESWMSGSRDHTLDQYISQ